MIIIDTNVVSELMRESPHPAVLAWFADHGADTLFLTAVSQAQFAPVLRSCPPVSDVIASSVPLTR